MTYESCVATKENLSDSSACVYHEGDFKTMEEAIKHMDEMVNEILAETDEYVVDYFIRDSKGYYYTGDELCMVRDELGV